MAALPAMPLLAGWLLATAAASALLTAATLVYARRMQLLDAPGRRRSHRLPTPRGGGAGPVLAWAAALGASLAVGPAPAHAAALLAGTGLVAVVGLLDDHRGLPAWPRLLVHLAAAALLVGSVRGQPAGVGDAAVFAVLVLGLAAVVNFWNFMDGIDGLAGMQSAFVALAIAAAAAIAGAAGLAMASALLAVAITGFLPFNTPRARIFLGDVGSGALGFACGGLLLLGWDAQALPAAVALLLPSAFLLDAGLTLLQRIAAGRRWYTAHREHLYQWLVRRGLPHARVVVLYLGWNLLIVTPLALATFLYRLPPVAALGAALAGGTVAWIAARRILLLRARRYGGAA